MNKLASILILGIVFVAFSFCSATKSNTKEAIQDNPPFKVIQAAYNTWVGGQPGVKGIKVTITIDNLEIKLDSVFFRNMKTKLKSELNTEPPVFVGAFTLPNTKNDYILHENVVKEYGNTPPNITVNIPFELEKNEAVISYLYEGNTQYYKIENLKETKSVIMY